VATIDERVAALEEVARSLILQMRVEIVEDLPIPDDDPVPTDAAEAATPGIQAATRRENQRRRRGRDRIAELQRIRTLLPSPAATGRHDGPPVGAGVETASPSPGHSAAK
jgi:hypothetical protein